jgi:lauroyl/myristoyl acyltransferase
VVDSGLLKRLHRGEFLCMMGDRVMGDEDPFVEAHFLGGTIRVPYLPYRLASASGATIVVTFVLRDGPGAGTLFLGDVLRVPLFQGNVPASYQPYAQKFLNSLEEFVKDHPYQFYNFYNLWER